MPSELNDYDILKFGALLHDIGKFLERANITEKIENNQIDYAHPKIGANFLKSLNIEPAIIDLVLYHHNPDLTENKRYLCKILQLSDWLSSGEREKTDEKYKTTPKYQHLISIFNEIVIEKNKSGEISEALKYKLAPLSFDDNTIFPKKDISGSYKTILGDFRKEIAIKLERNDFTGLLFVLQKYFWCVPSATWWQVEKNIPDISLFDHSKTTCAIASCLYKQEITEQNLGELIEVIKKKLRTKKEDGLIKQKLFSLIHGDLSGIQNFIYTIKTESAAKSLKGRSMAIVLLQRFIAEHILKALDLPLTNLIYSGGGHFYILAPKKLCDEKLKELRKSINKKIFENFGTKLYLALGAVDVCPEDFFDGNFAKKWKEAGDEVGKLKLRKYEELGYEELFAPFDEGGKKEICEICGRELEKDKKGEEDKKICSNCNQFINVVKYLKEVQKNGYFEVKEMKEELKVLKDFNTFLEEYDKIFLNPSEGAPFFGIPMGIPIEKDEGIKEFKTLAEDAEKDTGTKKIGILKMDVDNLGEIFTKGLKNNATISRMSTLSSMLSFFFEGYLNEFVNKKYKDDVYLIYAGGDDTLVVGRWDKLIDFADDVYNEFRRYTCNNPDITLSAGIVIVSPTYPLRKSVEMAESQLEKAKEVEQENHRKNSLCIFDQPLKWCIKEDESVNDFEMVKKIEKILVKCVKDENAPRQLIQRVNVSARGLKKALKKNKENIHGIDINDYWRLKYYFYRNYKDKNEKWLYPEINELINVLYEEIINRHVFKNDPKYKNTLNMILI